MSLPGTSVRGAKSGTRAIASAPTCITAFVGATQDGPSDQPRLVRSFTEFERTFGSSWSDGMLPHAVLQYFQNGGRDAVICRVEPSSGEISDEDISAPSLEAQRRGLWLLDLIKHFDLLCIPPPTRAVDIGPRTWEAALTYAERRGAMLLVDPPSAWTDLSHLSDQDQGLVSLVRRSSNGVIYFPRLVPAEPMQADQPRLFTPSGAVAGVIARITHELGPWHSPAGPSAVLHGFAGPSLNLSRPQGDSLVTLGVNPLRSFPSGVTVWGARTLAGSTESTSEFKFISVRRTALFIEHSLTEGLHDVATGPNDELTWARIRAWTSDFLHELFRQGAFQGTTPQEAFSVQCGADTTTQEEIDSGLVNIVVGFAPLKPAEFVTISLRQILGEPDGERRAPQAGWPGKPSLLAFEVEWDGQKIGGITSVSGLSQATEVTEVIEGSGALVRTVPGRTRFGPVMMTGLAPHQTFAEWARAVVTSSADSSSSFRKDVVIRLKDANGHTTATWTLRGAWVSKHVGPTLDAYGNQVALEEITLEAEGIDRSFTADLAPPV
jgi:uncharacterized protein